MNAIKLEPTDYGRVRPLLRGLDYNLATQAILAGTSAAEIYVDHAAAPRAVLARTGHRYFLAGEAGLEAFNRALGRLLAETIYPRAIEAGEELFGLHYDSTGWEAQLGMILGDRHPLRTQREYYVLRGSGLDRRSVLPAGFELRAADRALLEDERLMNLGALREEMVSERSDVDDFLARSFGLCPIHGDELAGWCLSEYNTPEHCEIGIATLPPFRRRGLATALTCAFVEQARARGIADIGWHCSARNVASAATARKAGFEKARDYTVYLTWFDPLYDRAVNGDVCLDEGRFEQAMAWYEQALALPAAPAWVEWGAARAAAALGERQAALRYLARAVEKGFIDVVRIRAEGHLASLHGDPQWEALLRRAAALLEERDDE